MKSIYFRHFLTTSMMILLSFLVLGSSFMTLAFQYLSSERQAQLKSASYYVSDYTSNSTEYLSTTKKFIRGEQLVFSVSSYFDYVTFLVVLAQVTDTNIFTVDALSLIHIWKKSDEGPGGGVKGRIGRGTPGSRRTANGAD